MVVKKDVDASVTCVHIDFTEVTVARPYVPLRLVKQFVVAVNLEVSEPRHSQPARAQVTPVYLSLHRRLSCPLPSRARPPRVSTASGSRPRWMCYACLGGARRGKPVDTDVRVSGNVFQGKS